MLGDHPIHVVLLATNLDEAKAFYQGKIGLQLLKEDSNALTFKSGPTQLVLSNSTTGTGDEQTQASWLVDDLFVAVCPSAGVAERSNAADVQEST